MTDFWLIQLALVPHADSHWSLIPIQRVGSCCSPAHLPVMTNTQTGPHMPSPIVKSLQNRFLLLWKSFELIPQSKEKFYTTIHAISHTYLHISFIKIFKFTHHSTPLKPIFFDFYCDISLVSPKCLHPLTFELLSKHM